MKHLYVFCSFCFYLLFIITAFGFLEPSAFQQSISALIAGIYFLTLYDKERGIKTK